MAEWKTQVNYNYNPTFHAYTYGFLYQAGAQQNHGSGWSENPEQNGYNSGHTQVNFAARGREVSPPSPEHRPENSHYYQDSGLLYVRESKTDRLVLAGPQRVTYDGGDSTSDSEAHISPDSWSSGSTHERSVPQTEPAVWVKNEAATGARSPDHSGDVSSSLMDSPQSFAAQDTGDANCSVHATCTATKKQISGAQNAPKTKVRSAFSEIQMNTLVQRFSMQKYLTPAEMKNLADVTGLTQKQVKTWFQNRRMKLRRHQKDTSWVSERYAINKADTATNTSFTNMPPHVPPNQGDGVSHLRDPYNQHVMGTAFKNTPQNLAFYLTAMGNRNGSAAYPPWSSSQASVPSRPQALGWPIPPGCGQFDFRPLPFDSTGAPSLRHKSTIDSKDEEAGASNAAAVLHNAVQ